MKLTSTPENRTKHPSELLVAKAVCIFSETDSRMLFATNISLAGAFILSMRPPELGTLLSIVFSPLGLPALSPIKCRVIGCRIDPSNAERSGFEVVFTYLDSEQLKDFYNALNDLEKIAEQARRPIVHSDETQQERLGAERRIYPRVLTSLNVSVHTPDGEPILMNLVNLSMSGALLELGEIAMPSFISIGAKVLLTITNISAPETVSINARVVRFSNPNEPKGFAVHFIQLSEVLAGRIEGLLLSILSKDTDLC